MSDDSQDFFVGHLARVDGSDAGSIASLSSGDEMSQYGLFDEDIFLPLPAQDTSVFDEPHSIPEAVRSLAYNHAIWEPSFLPKMFICIIPKNSALMFKLAINFIFVWHPLNKRDSSSFMSLVLTR